MDAREIDAKLAEHLFGWQKRDHPQGGKYWVDGAGWALAWTEEVPDWSGTGSGMLLVMEAMRERGWAIMILTEGGGYAVAFAHPRVREMPWVYMSILPGYEWDLPLAVALAACRALGLEVE